MYKANYCVCETHRETEFAWNVPAPFSALAHSGDGLEFFKRLRYEPQQFQEALYRQTEATILEINGKLPCVVSIADSYANAYTISENDMQAFSLPFFARLLRGLNLSAGAVIHICPYCSELLERYGFLCTLRITLPSIIPYTKVIEGYANSGRGVILGGQCIHTKETDHAFVLRMAEDSA